MRVPFGSLLLVVAAASSLSCGSSCPVPAAPVAQHDVARDREALMQTDRDFAKATAARGVDGWLSFFADDGAQLPAKKDIVEGKAAIHALMTPLFSDADLRLEWEPAGADASGDLGTWKVVLDIGNEDAP